MKDPCPKFSSEVDLQLKFIEERAFKEDQVWSNIVSMIVWESQNLPEKLPGPTFTSKQIFI